MAEFLSRRYNGIIGDTFSFLDLISPERLEIVGRAADNIANDNCRCHFEGHKDIGGTPIVGIKFANKRILMRRRLENENRT